MSYNLVRMFIAEGMVNRGFLDRMTNVTYAARNGTPLCRLEYAYDPDGLVTQRVVAAASGAVTNSYAYDGLMRLTSERDSRGNFATNTYDLCGNRLAVVTSVGTSGHTYTHNRRDADTHDAAGSVTHTVNARGQTLGLTWNLQRQLISVSTNGVFAESYAYDPLGRRASTTDAGGTVYHAYDGIHCVADLSQDGNLLRSYTWGAGIDNLLAVTLYDGDSTNTLYAVTDPLGTVHALVDANGGIAVAYTYDSWGKLLSVSGDTALAVANRFTWQGREYSHATELYNFRARWYDPAAGRWLSKDPIGLEGGLNLYEAFGNNPVCFRDPEGEYAASLAMPIVETGTFAETAVIGAAATPVVIGASFIFVGAVGYYIGAEINNYLDEQWDFNDVLGDILAKPFNAYIIKKHTEEYNSVRGEHTKNSRRSTRDDHQKANGRRRREQDPDKRYIPGKRKKHNKNNRNHGIIVPPGIPVPLDSEEQCDV